jgi:hypothetical protein
MGLLKFLQLCAFSAIMVAGVLLNSAEPTALIIRFRRAPPPQSRFSTAIFQYSVERLDGSNACKKNGCSIHCKVSFPSSTVEHTCVSVQKLSPVPAVKKMVRVRVVNIYSMVVS